MGRAQKNLAHKLAMKHNPLHYKRIPFEKVKNVTKKQSDKYMVSKMPKGTVIGVGVGP